MPKSIAIACQGGGSHTVFAAGVLQAILSDNIDNDAFEIVALSGTSGGAICSLLAWYGLLRDGRAGENGVIDGKRDAIRLLDDFWTRGWPEGNSANTYREAVRKFAHALRSMRPWEAPIPFADRARNDFVQWAGRWMTSPAVSVVPEVSPYFLTALLNFPGLALMPGFDVLKREIDVQEALRSLLNSYVDFDEVKEIAAEDGRLLGLLIGAVDVLAGDFKIFTSEADPHLWRADGITADAVVASAAIPTIMRGVRLGGSVFWDGLFCQNPPLHDLAGIHVDRDRARSPDEIWIIRINPVRIGEVPTDIVAIQDRRNELAGNVSLGFDLRAIRKMNELIASGVVRDPRYKHIDIREIEMSDSIARGLDTLSKLDRKPSLLDRLMEHGKHQGEAFIRDWNASLRP